MRNNSTVTVLAAAALIGPGVGALAQQDPGDAERARQDAPRSEAELVTSQQALAQSEQELQSRRTELERARAELEMSRQKLELAAREVARLSAAPVFGDRRVMTRLMMPNRPGAVLGFLVGNADGGALVISVSPGGPAAGAGIEAGDVIVAIDGIDLTQGEGDPMQRVVGHLREVEPAATVNLVVSRDGETRTFDVETRENDGYFFFAGDEPFNVAFAPGPKAAAPGVQVFGPGTANGTNFVRVFSPFSSPWREMELVPLSEQLGRYFGATEGLLVVRAPDNDAIGLEDGDVILAIGGRAPTSPEHAMRILGSFEVGETLELSIMRQQRRRMIEYEIPSPN